MNAKSSVVKPSQRKRQGPLSSRFQQAMDRMAFNWNVRSELYIHLSACLENNVQLEDGLDQFCKRLIRTKKISSLKIVSGLATRMRDGESFATAIQNWVPPDEYGVIAGGAISGKYGEAFELVVEAKTRLENVKQGLKSSLFTPAIYSIALLFVLFVIARWVTPSLQQTLPLEKAQGIVYVMYVTSDFVNSIWMLLVPILLGGIVAGFSYILPRWTGPNRIYFERFLPFSYYRDINGYMWLMSYAALLKTEMVDTEILKNQKADATPWLHERLHLLWQRLDNGMRFSDALIEKGKHGMPSLGFPNPDIIDSLESFEGPHFADRVNKLCGQWSNRLEKRTLAMAKSLGLAIEFVMYGLMALLMIAINVLAEQMSNMPQL